jgi:hypothetical protein
MLKNIGYLLTLVAFISCSTKKLVKQKDNGEDIYKKHIVEVSPRGKHQNKKILEGGKKLYQKEHFNYIIQGIDDHLSNGNKKILIFFHGGLNARQSSFKRALKHTELISKDGIYPVFFNWHSGAISSYGQQLGGVSAGLDYRRMKIFAAPFMLASDLVTGIVKSPLSGFNNASTFFLNIGRYDKNGAKWTRTRKNTMGIYAVLEERMKKNPSSELKVQWGEDDRKGIRPVIRGAQATLFGCTRIVGQVAIWDGLGTAAWINMKKRAHALFHPNLEFDVRGFYKNHDSVAKRLDTQHSGVLAQFIDTLNQYLQKRGKKDYEITVIGHSMGAIVANDLLIQYPDFPVDNIVHMAGASSIREVSYAVFPYLSKHRKSRYYNLSLHPASENRESLLNTELLLPRGTLLVQIDNMFEQPASFMDRTSGKWENIIQATHLIPDSIRNQVTLKCFDIKNNQKAHGNKSNGTRKEQIEDFKPQKHGQFDNGIYWDERFWTVK